MALSWSSIAYFYVVDDTMPSGIFTPAARCATNTVDVRITSFSTGDCVNLAREIFGKTSQWSELDYEDGRRTTSEDKEGS